MAITDASPPSKVVIELDLLQPFAASNTVEFTLAPERRRHGRDLGDAGRACPISAR